jgi:hypothetical protein
MRQIIGFCTMGGYRTCSIAATMVSVSLSWIRPVAEDEFTASAAPLAALPQTHMSFPGQLVMESAIL